MWSLGLPRRCALTRAAARIPALKVGPVLRPAPHRDAVKYVAHVPMSPQCITVEARKLEDDCPETPKPREQGKPA